MSVRSAMACVLGAVLLVNPDDQLEQFPCAHEQAEYRGVVD